MSVHVSSWAWKQKLGDPGLKLVLVKLADNADDSGYSFWRQKNLADECEMSKPTLQRKLAKLEEMGLLQVVPRFGSDGSRVANGYRLVRPGTPPQSEVGATSLKRGGPPHGSDVAEPSTQPEDPVVVEQASLLGDDEPAAKPQPKAPKLMKLVGSVAGKAVTDSEYELAVAVLGAFNSKAETNFTGKEWLKTILMRIRENPAMTLPDFTKVVEQAFHRPWWGRDSPTPAVVFSGKAFDIAKNAKPTERDSDDDLSIYN